MSQSEVEDALRGQEFWFPIEQGQIQVEQEKVFYKSVVRYQIQTDLLKVPILSDFQTSIQVDIHQGVIDQNIDWTGFFDRVPSFTEGQLFFQIDNKPQKMLHPRSFDSKTWQSPFQIEIKISDEALIVQNLRSATLIGLLIGFGGLNRSFYFIGMILAHSVAKMMYQRALISELYLEQKSDLKDAQIKKEQS